MQLEIGKIYEGKVKGIAQYGAFVEIDGASTGMVHISEIANTFVKDVKDYLKEDQLVKVKVLAINDDGKVSLSIKKASDNQEQQQGARPQKRFDRNNGGGNREHFDRGGDRNGDRGGRDRKPNVWEPKKKPPVGELGFEDMLNRFKQSSEENICALKRSTERKNGSRRK